MKFNQTALIAALALMPVAPAFAQALPTQAPVVAQTVTPENQVSLHPTSLLVNQLVLEGERRLSPSWSVLVAPKIGLGKLVDNELGQVMGRSIGLEAGGRWYAASHALKGFFLQPSVSYNYHWPKDTSVHMVALHGKAGYQWAIADRAFISLAAGVQYLAAFGKDAGQSNFEKVSGFLPDGSFGIGVGF